MKILSSNPYGKNRASVLQHANAPRKDDLNRFLSYWRNHKAVTKLRLVDRAQNDVMFNVDLKSEGGWVTKAILDNNAFFLTAIPVIGGIEKWSILVENENKTSLFSQLDRVGVVRINQIKKLELDDKERISQKSSLVSNLSPKQFQILKTAVENGYFDCPRRTDSRQLARQIGIAQSTLLEHLRKAQLKILRRAICN